MLGNGFFDRVTDFQMGQGRRKSIDNASERNFLTELQENTWMSSN